MARPTEAKINTAALRHNAQVARDLAPGAKLLAVVKANAYGHGAVPVAKTLQDLVDAFAVATLDEAVELRDADVTAPILLLQGVFEPRELGVAAGLGLWLTIHNNEQLDWLEQAQLPARVCCWLKLDTGMSRLGIAPEEAPAILDRLGACDNCLDDIVLCTHFAAADNLADTRTAAQIRRFESVSFSGERSAANSAGVLAWPQAHYDWVRPGFMLYGQSPMLAAHPNAADLQPAMSLVSAITALREVPAGQSVGYGGTFVATRTSRIATVPIGYGDGYPRAARNGTPVLVRGQRATLAGRVSMDMITVDVTDIEGVTLGDEVVLWGEDLPAAEIASFAGTIGYELTTRMPTRVPRTTVGD